MNVGKIIINVTVTVTLLVIAALVLRGCENARMTKRAEMTTAVLAPLPSTALEARAAGRLDEWLRVKGYSVMPRELAPGAMSDMLPLVGYTICVGPSDAKITWFKMDSRGNITAVSGTSQPGTSLFTDAQFAAVMCQDQKITVLVTKG